MGTPNINAELTLDEQMSIDRFMEEYKDLPASDSFGISATLEYMQYSEQAFSDIQKFIMTEELKYYANNKAILFEDANPANSPARDSFINKLIEKFVGWLRKIKEYFAGVWKAIVERVNDMNVINKAFLMKFKKQIDYAEKKVHVIKFTGWDFSNIDEVPTFYFLENPDEMLSNDKPLSDTYLSTTKSKILSIALYGKENAVKNFDDDNDKLNSILRMRFYSTISDTSKGLGKKERMYKISEEIDNLKASARDIRLAKIAYDKVNTALQTYEKLFSLKLASKDFKLVDDGNGGKKKEYTNTTGKNLEVYIQALKYNIDINKRLYDAYTQAIIDRTRQAKAILIKAMQENPYQENAVIDDTLKLRSASLDDIYAATVV